MIPAAQYYKRARFRILIDARPNPNPECRMAASSPRSVVPEVIPGMPGRRLASPA